MVYGMNRQFKCQLISLTGKIILRQSKNYNYKS